MLVTSCERSHLYLKNVLPKVADCLHDVSETVRVAMLDLLTEVKHVRVIKYWQVRS